MKKLKAILLITILCGLSGCATTNKDPLEGINRGIYKFNDVTDRYALKPVAKAYKAVAPQPVRTGISNFFSNLGTLTTIVNDLLQLKFAQAFTDAGRFVINTTFGIAGFIDVASMDKIEKHNEDFGQTLGHWGVGPGPYLVIPILGPSTVRDAGGLAFDTVTSDPITYLHNTGQIRAHNQVRLVQLLDKRTQLLDATDLVDNASIDPYAFMRDAYLQRRAILVQDGLVPKELLQDEFEEDAPDEGAMQESSAPTESIVLQSAAPLDEQVAPEQTKEVVETDALQAMPEAAPEAAVSEAANDTAEVAEVSVATEPQETLPPLMDPVDQLADEPVVMNAEPAEKVARVDEAVLAQEVPAMEPQ